VIPSYSLLGFNDAHVLGFCIDGCGTIFFHPQVYPNLIRIILGANFKLHPQLIRRAPKISQYQPNIKYFAIKPAVFLSPLGFALDVCRRRGAVFPPTGLDMAIKPMGLSCVQVRGGF
jgi:hypothetical protein